MKFPKEFLNKIKSIEPIIKSIREAGETAYLVGGSVRDLVLGREVKDFDIEVHRIGIEELEKILKEFGSVSLIGKQFGVLRIHHLDIDWSLPRKDSKGRKPSVVVDPEMTVESACRRRDLTINAMALDLGELATIIDPYGGLDDLKSKTLRAVDEKLFSEDPLRFYRVMQFISRLGFKPDKKLNEICKNMDLRQVTDGGEIARERIYEEIKKMCLRSERPSLGWRWLREIGRLDELFPELGVLVGVKQREDYHPEGDVFEHTMQVLDASATLPASAALPVELPESEKFIIMLGALCHDFGKATKTDEEGKSRGHDEAGVAPAKKFLHRFTRDSFLIRSVCKLVRYHRMPLVLVEQESSQKAYKRLAVKLAPEVDFQKMYLIAWCDIRGRNPKGQEPLKDGFKSSDKILNAFLDKIKQAKVERHPEESVLHGRDLLDVIKPGPELGRLLKLAYDIQIDEGVVDRDELRRRVLKAIV